MSEWFIYKLLLPTPDYPAIRLGFRNALKNDKVHVDIMNAFSASFTEHTVTPPDDVITPGFNMEIKADEYFGVNQNYQTNKTIFNSGLVVTTTNTTFNAASIDILRQLTDYVNGTGPAPAEILGVGPIFIPGAPILGGKKKSKRKSRRKYKKY